VAEQPRDDDIDEIRRTIRVEQARLRAQLLKAERRKIAEHQVRIRQALERTDGAQELAEAGLAREFFLQAVEDMATVKQESENSIRELANLLVQDLDVPTTTVAKKTGVSHTTIYRWLDPDRKGMSGQ
jgi:DNA-binding phage protein